MMNARKFGGGVLPLTINTERRTGTKLFSYKISERRSEVE